jgi:hypothetical protein
MDPALLIAAATAACRVLLRAALAAADTLSAAYYAQFALNGGRPVGQSIPATEHSVMTSWPSGTCLVSSRHVSSRKLAARPRACIALRWDGGVPSNLWGALAC